jgi:hypothetical protein
MDDKYGEQWRSQPCEAKAAMAQPCELLPNDGAAEFNPKAKRSNGYTVPQPRRTMA